MHLVGCTLQGNYCTGNEQTAILVDHTWHAQLIYAIKPDMSDRLVVNILNYASPLVRKKMSCTDGCIAVIFLPFLVCKC